MKASIVTYISSIVSRCSGRPTYCLKVISRYFTTLYYNLTPRIHGFAAHEKNVAAVTMNRMPAVIGKKNALGYRLSWNSMK